MNNLTADRGRRAQPQTRGGAPMSESLRRRLADLRSASPTSAVATADSRGEVSRATPVVPSTGSEVAPPRRPARRPLPAKLQAALDARHATPPASDSATSRALQNRAADHALLSSSANSGSTNNTSTTTMTTTTRSQAHSFAPSPSSPSPAGRVFAERERGPYNEQSRMEYQRPKQHGITKAPSVVMEEEDDKVALPVPAPNAARPRWNVVARAPLTNAQQQENVKMHLDESKLRVPSPRNMPLAPYDRYDRSLRAEDLNGPSAATLLRRKASNDDTMPMPEANTRGQRVAADDDTVRFTRTEHDYDSAVPGKAESTSGTDLANQMAVLQATLASTEERFLDARQRHQRELQELTEKHRIELERAQARATAVTSRDSLSLDSLKDQPSLKESMLQNENSLLQQQLDDTERDHRERERILQQRIRNLERQAMSEGGAAVSAERGGDSSSQVRALQSEVKTMRANATLLERQVQRLTEEKEQVTTTAASEQRRLESENVTLSEQLQAAVATVKECEHQFQAQSEQWLAKERDLLSRLEECTASVTQLEEEREELVRHITDLERRADHGAETKSVNELLNLFMAAEQERDELKKELEMVAGSSGKTTTTETVYVSNDAELMQFIEIMTAKMDKYRLEAESLRVAADNKPLTTSKETDANTKDVHQLRRDLDTALAGEQCLQQEVAALYKELDRLSFNYADVDAERHKMSTTVGELRTQLEATQEQLHAEMAKSLSISPDENESAALQALRRDLRRQLSNIRQEYGDALKRELERRVESEKALRAVRRETEMKAYAKDSAATQTVESLMLTSQSLTLFEQME